MIANSDLQPNARRELDMLSAHDKSWSDKWVDTDYDDHGKFMLYKADGSYYHEGHGREKCRHVKCVVSGQRERPINCGFNFNLDNLVLKYVFVDVTFVIIDARREGVHPTGNLS